MLTLSQLRFIVEKAKDQRDDALQICEKSEEVFRLAKDRVRIAYGALRKAEARLRNAERKIILHRRHSVATLTYDNFRDPLPAGIRGGPSIHRQLLYQAGCYCVDFRLEHERGSPEITLIGQITCRERPDVAIADMPVLLLSGRSVLAETLSNHCGEFHMKCRFVSSLRVYALHPNEDEVIEIPLAECFPPYDT